MTRHILFTLMGCFFLSGVIDPPRAFAALNIVGIECSRDENRFSINPFTVDDVYNPASLDSDWLEVVKGRPRIKGDFIYYAGERIEHQCKLKGKTIDTLVRYRQPSEYGPDAGDPVGVLDVSIDGSKVIDEATFHRYAHPNIRSVSYSQGKLEVCVSNRETAKCINVDNTKLPVTDITLDRILIRE